MDLLADYRHRRDERRIRLLEARMACMEQALRNCYTAMTGYQFALHALRNMLEAREAGFDLEEQSVH